MREFINAYTIGAYPLFVKQNRGSARKVRTIMLEGCPEEAVGNGG
jgi:hypothetical protein